MICLKEGRFTDKIEYERRRAAPCLQGRTALSARREVFNRSKDPSLKIVGKPAFQRIAVIPACQVLCIGINC